MQKEFNEESSYPSFDDLDQVVIGDFDDDEPEPEWIDLEDGQSLVGELVGVTENAGIHNNRLYKLRTDDGPALLWGATNLDFQFNQAGVEAGDVIGVRRTAERFTTTDENGEPVLNEEGEPRQGVKYELRRL